MSEFNSILELLEHTIIAGPAVHDVDWTRTWEGTLPPTDLTTCSALVLLMRQASASIPEMQSFLIAAAPTIESNIRLQRPHLYAKLQQPSPRRPQLAQFIVAVIAELASIEALSKAVTPSNVQHDAKLSAPESLSATHASIQMQGGNSSNLSLNKEQEITPQHNMVQSFGTPNDDPRALSFFNLDQHLDRTGVAWIAISNTTLNLDAEPRAVAIRNRTYWVLPGATLLVASDDGRYEYGDIERY